MLLTFQNYSASLGFFPDTFTPLMAHDNATLYKLEAKANARECAVSESITEKCHAVSNHQRADRAAHETDEEGSQQTVHVSRRI